MIERIGIIGGGQLGRMLTEAAHPLGFDVTVIDPVTNCPAAQVGAEQIESPLYDEEAIRQLAESTDVLTWEIEHIPADFLVKLEKEGVNIQPSPSTLETIQDKYSQKTLLRDSGIPTPTFAANPTEMKRMVVNHHQFDFIAKTRRGGFDGRGNLVIDSLDDPSIAEHFGPDPKLFDRIYVEKMVDFDKEIAVIVARDLEGNVEFFPVVETVHRDNICHEVLAPASIDRRVKSDAIDLASDTMTHFIGAGVFAIEMFVDRGNDVLVNEIAPRVHNSGHYSTEACVTSQFEQHIRAITGLPLGSTKMRSPAAVMINILGSKEGPLDRDGLERVTAMVDTHPHFYGKTPRVARKVGHITVLGESLTAARAIAQAARKELSI